MTITIETERRKLTVELAEYTEEFTRARVRERLSDWTASSDLRTNLLRRRWQSSKTQLKVWLRYCRGEVDPDKIANYLKMEFPHVSFILSDSYAGSDLWP